VGIACTLVPLRGSVAVALVMLVACAPNPVARSAPSTTRSSEAVSTSATTGPTSTELPPTDAASSTLPASSTTVASPGWRVFARSVKGRPLRITDVGSGPRRVLWIGGIHGDEPEGKAATAALADAFLSTDLGQTVSLTILEDANPDGRAAFTRVNANGVDLNRNFPSSNFDTSQAMYGRHPLSQPESKAIADEVLTIKPQLIVVCHAWAGASFINYDGPAAALAARFSADSGMAVRSDSRLGETTPGSLGAWAGNTVGIAVLTIEFLRGSNSTRDWQRTRKAILDVIRG
jgi:protein MpaA